MDCREILLNSQIQDIVVSQELREEEVFRKQLFVVLRIYSNTLKEFLKRKEESVWCV